MKVVQELKLKIEKNESKICSGFEGDCRSSNGITNLNVVFFNELSNSIDSITLTATIIDTPFDLIIGKPTLYETKLLSKVAVQFWEGTEMLESGIDIHDSRQSVRYLNLIAPQLLATLLDQNEYLHWQDDSEGIEMRTTNTGWDLLFPNEDPSIDNIPSNIVGSEDFTREIKSLCTEYSDIFSREIKAEPAKIPPMELNVDSDKWHTYKNKQPPRPQTVAKQVSIKKYIDKYGKIKAIRQSNAIHYSQVHMTPKPNNDWRFCCDFRALNDATVSSNWPIPNIDQMLNRIGSHKPNFFGIVDMTSGYHQAPMHENSIYLTAFICFMGIYEWCRVAMGLKGAGGYFQRSMATIVLAGLIYIICELYLDDCIIYANSETEFLERLRQIFQRFREYNITLNPDKVILGANEIEYVGHLLNSQGKSFTRDKINSAIEIEQPLTEQDLKQFLGLANYFRSHINNMSKYMYSLQQMLKNYNKNSKKLLNWTPMTQAAYETIVDLIRNCPMLYFMDESAPVFLYTDACDHGIGAYLYQLVNGEERPVAFMSKSLSGAQLNWSTPEKEAFAIYSALIKFEHLIRDIHFTLKTDHANLTFIDKGTGKILRWKLAIQEYDFDLEYVPGIQNPVADAFSRLCVLTEEIILSEDFKIPQHIYKKLSNVHNSSVGHFGEKITYERLIDQGLSYPYLRQYVRRFIKMCPCCQKMSYLKIPIHTLPFVTSTYHPMQRLNIDTIGPLPISDREHTHIIVVIDTFTRFVELYPVINTSAKEASYAILNHAGRYGCPSEIVSDNGSQFSNEIINHLLQLLEINHNFTIAYSKEENAIVERSNKEVMRHLRAIIFDKDIVSEWFIYLPMVMRIINSKKHESTNVSPSELLFGGQVNLNNNLLGNKLQLEPQSLSKWSSDMILKQQTLIAIAAKNQRNLNERHLLDDDGTEITSFPINSYVLLTYTNQPTNKLSTNLSGPYQVMSNIGPNYKILNIATNRHKNVHISRLRKFNFDSEFTNPRLIANKDDKLYDVVNITKHKGKPNRSNGTNMSFYVEWTDSSHTWEPWISLRSNKVLHQYLISKNLKHIIPKSYLDN